MTTPSEVRAGLRVVTGAARADVRAVAGAAGEDPAEVRAALFAATPLIVAEYANGSAALALDWYEELREVAEVVSRFVPRPLTLVTDDDVRAAVAGATKALHEIEQGFLREVEKTADEQIREALTESLELVELQVEEQVVSGFTDTMTGNVEDDPDAVGWKRHARPEACKFCLMLAARGAVYTRETARFAAHGAFTNGKRTGGNCMCIAGPAFGGQGIWAEATPMQYMASRRTRSPEQRAALREYLNENFPDAPG